MKLWSPAWINGEPIPARFAAGRLDAAGRVVPSDNLSPPLAWSDLPAGTRSLVLVCHDFDMPLSREGTDGLQGELPADAPRADFFHWLLVDLPPGSKGLAEGACGAGSPPVASGGAGAAGPCRQGLNDQGRWQAGAGEVPGSSLGYHGPLPPCNDSLVHHYLFALYAVDVPVLAVHGAFNGHQVRDALTGHVLGAATLSGTYTLNRRLKAAQAAAGG